MLLSFIIVIVLIVLNIPLYKLIFKLFFKDSEDFSESLKYSFTPDIISLFRGEYWKDQMGQAKLSFLFISGLHKQMNQVIHNKKFQSDC
jgi:hypothetical protein